MTLGQFVLVLSSVELTSIRVILYKLRVTALLSCGCRPTVGSLFSVHSSPLVAELPRWMAIAHGVSAKFKAFSFLVIIRIPCFTVSPHLGMHVQINTSQ